MTATAANMAELEAALENLLRTISDGKKAMMDCKGEPGLMQTAILALHFSAISGAHARYLRAREEV